MLQEKLKQAKSTYETTLVLDFASSQNHKIYKYINSLSSKNSLPATMFLDSSSANSDLEKASLFNKYFHSILTRSSFVLPPIDQLPPVAPLLSDISLTTSDVHSELTKLDPSKSMGIDNIGPKILKYCADALYLPIHHLFCLSLSYQSLPAEWCLHSVTPIFLSGDRTSFKNYRPIYLLCTISLIVECLIFNQILLVTSATISHFQFGFTKNCSTLHQLLLFINHIYIFLLKRRVRLMLFILISKKPLTVFLTTSFL